MIWCVHGHIGATWGCTHRSGGTVGRKLSVSSGPGTKLVHKSTLLSSSLYNILNL